MKFILCLIFALSVSAVADSNDLRNRLILNLKVEQQTYKQWLGGKRKLRSLGAQLSSAEQAQSVRKTKSARRVWIVRVLLPENLGEKIFRLKEESESQKTVVAKLYMKNQTYLREAINLRKLMK